LEEKWPFGHRAFARTCGTSSINVFAFDIDVRAAFREVHVLVGTLVFKIKIKFFKFYLLALLLLATNTTGFDVYFHAISVADFELIDYYNPTWIVSGYELPRYILLHYFLWLITCFGYLPLLPLLAIFYALGLMKAVNFRYTHGLIKHVVVATMIVNIIFTSALGISLFMIGLGVLARTDKKFSNSFLLICLGSTLHPIGFLIGFSLLLVLRGWVYLLILMVMILFSHYLTVFTPLNFTGHQRMFDFEDLLDVNSLIYEKVVGKLSVEVFALFALYVIYLLFKASSKIHEVRFFLNSFSQLVSIVNVHYIIYFMLAAALVKSYPSHLTTGGPLAVLSLQYKELNKETLNIISAAWITPYFLHESIKFNQYRYRGD